ncbi:hypothetical protein Dimus_030375, partial [Dionaea muscipula]
VEVEEAEKVGDSGLPCKTVVAAVYRAGEMIGGQAGEMMMADDGNGASKWAVKKEDGLVDDGNRASRG